MTIKAPVQPTYGRGQIVTPGAVSAQINIDAQAKQVVLTNLGANVCYVRVGSGSQAATTADYPVPAGAQMVISKGDGDSTLAHISAAGTTLHVIPGEGF